MFEINHELYQTFMQNPNFIHNHQMHFLKDLRNVYRNNMHLSPFFKDIRAFTDNLDAPEIIVINRGGNLLLSGNGACDTYDKALLKYITGCFNEGNGTLWLNVATETLKIKMGVLFSAYHPESSDRYNFRLNREAFHKLPNWRSLIPAGFSVECFDTQPSDFRERYGKTDEVFFPESKRFAFVTLFADKIVSECFSVLVDDNMVEIGIHTYDESLRRQGLAFLTSSAFIEHCLNNNLETSWSCDCDNFASASLAKKLGYELICKELGIAITKSDT